MASSTPDTVVELPQKPWEEGGGGTMSRMNGSSNQSGQLTASSSDRPPLLTSTSAPPPVPSRPSFLSGSYSGYGFGQGPGNAGAYGGYGGSSAPYTGYGSYGNAYGTYGGYGGYGGPYNRFGSAYGSFGTGYGGYGSYGTYSRGFGSGMYGQRLAEDHMQPTAIVQSTQSTFDLLDQIVQSFSGFARMLESTFHATYSSFMAMVSAAEQFRMFRSYLGRIFSVLALTGSLQGWLGRFLMGHKSRERERELISVKEFQQGQQAGSSHSKKPLLVFLAVVVGMPLLFTRLMRSRVESSSQSAVNPDKILFARAEYDFHATNDYELPLKQGDLIAVLDQSDPVTGQSGDWWKGKLRKGGVGWFPKNFVRVVGDLESLRQQKGKQQVDVTEDETRPN